jgi:hypothetical protein
MRSGRFAFNWFVIALVLVIGASAFSGYDSIDGGFPNLFEGLGTVVSLLGGIGSFITLVIVVAAGIFILVGLLHMCGRDYTDHNGLRWAHSLIGLGVVIAAAWIGLKWIDVPSATGWVTALILFIITAATVAVTPFKKKARTIEPTTPAPVAVEFE